MVGYPGGMDRLPAAAVHRLSRPGSEDNPVRLRAYLRQAGQQEPSVHLSIPHGISCGMHVEALPAVAGDPSGESIHLRFVSSGVHELTAFGFAYFLRKNCEAIIHAEESEHEMDNVGAPAA